MRRRAMELARSCALPESDAGRLAIVVTEMASNAVRHGADAAMLLGGDPDAGLVECICVDRGRGMSDIAACMRDGFSTAGTPGTGLGAIRRQSDAFDIYSLPQRGTAVLSRVLRQGRDPGQVQRRHGAVCIAKSGEQISGDAWSVDDDGVAMRCLVADGLGHGPLAADAARMAVKLFRSARDPSPGPTVDRLNQGLHGTRGAAVAVALVDRAARRVTYGGLGNIAGSITSDGRTRRMISQNGTAGLRGATIQTFEFAYGLEPILVMHSDGVSASWSFDSYPGLAARDPTLIAAVLMRDLARGRDDATVLVAKP